jgi:hypothetical protein
MSSLKLLSLAVLSVAALACEKAPLTAPVDSTLSVFVNPPFIVANGGVSVISAFVVEPAGTPVPDGTVVFFFTTLGRIEPQGKTKDGVARVNLVADSRSGIAKVTAATGNVVSDAQEVAIGSKLPTKMVVTANPPYLAGAREATITANVFDDNGNPVQNVPVIFTVEPVGTAPLREVLASGGSPQYTDSNGQAFDTLATRTANGVSVKTVTVTATTANLLTESVSVIVNYSAVS